MGRKSTFTQEIADKIIARLSTGEPLAQICRDDGFPHDDTVRNWMDADPVFAHAIARAREKGFDAIALDCLRIADDSSSDTIETENGPRVNAEFVARSRLRVDTRLKLLAKWDPKRYGDRTILAGDPEAPLSGLTDAEIEAKAAALHAKRTGKPSPESK
ncbi:MAG: hypothetical protein RL758_189 [Pseudomonadota bacterium]